MRLSLEKLYVEFFKRESMFIRAEHTRIDIERSGPEQKMIKNLAQKLNVEKNVVFEDWQNDLSSYYKTAHLFLLTSNYEGYGMTLVEAIASHCPNVEPKTLRHSLRLSVSSVLSSALRAVSAAALTCLMKSLKSFGCQCFATFTDA